MNQRMMESRITEMIQTHPKQPALPIEQLGRAIEAIVECGSVCTICADACLAEQHVQMLVHCIQLNQECADICHTTAATLLRPGSPAHTVLPLLLQACQSICESCGQECEQHASMHEHCRVCAQSCRNCAQLCAELMQSTATKVHR